MPMVVKKTVKKVVGKDGGAPVCVPLTQPTALRPTAVAAPAGGPRDAAGAVTASPARGPVKRTKVVVRQGTPPAARLSAGAATAEAVQSPARGPVKRTKVVVRQGTPPAVRPSAGCEASRGALRDSVAPASRAASAGRRRTTRVSVRMAVVDAERLRLAAGQRGMTVNALATSVIEDALGIDERAAFAGAGCMKFRLTQSERDAVFSNAHRLGMSMSSFVRMRCAYGDAALGVTTRELEILYDSVARVINNTAQISRRLEDASTVATDAEVPVLRGLAADVHTAAKVAMRLRIALYEELLKRGRAGGRCV